MWSIFSILFFVAILGFPVVYTILRKLFPRNSKRYSMWIAGIITAVLVIVFGLVMAGII